jgi:hypothetical protein
LNDENPSLKPDESTYCNYGTQNVMSTVASIEGNNGLKIDGMANSMSKKLASSSDYHQVDKEAAKESAGNGKLVVLAYEENPHGHVATFSVGTNRQKGEIANIGRRNGFKPLESTPGHPGGVFSFRFISRVKYYVEGSGSNTGRSDMPEYFH